MDFLNEHYEITNDVNDKIKSSELLHNYNTFSENRVRADQLKEKMSYNNFILKKFRDGNYYLGLKEKVEITDTNDKDYNLD